MISPCYEIGILCAVILWIFYLKYRKGIVHIPVTECIVLYFFARVFPIMMLSEKTVFHWINLAIDLVILAALLWIRILKKKKFHFSQAVFLLYLGNPAMAVAVVSGKLSAIVSIGAVAIIASILLWIFKITKERKTILDFYPMYVAFSFSIFFYFVATECCEQDFTMFSKKEDGIPVLLIISLVGILLSLGYALVRMVWKREEYRGEVVSETTETQSVEETFQKEPFGKTDFLFLIGSTLLMGVLTFYRLGAMYEPQTTMDIVNTGHQENEFILDLGETKEISKISMFFDNTAQRTISFSIFNEDTGEWEPFAENQAIGSAYCWEEYKTDVSARYLGIVCMDHETLLSEVVLVGPDNQVITPVNSSDYPLLFDEQSYYPPLRSYYYRTMFDEIYHARTANEIVRGTKIYENTHPQLGKILMGLGIRMFGMNPFGYRFVCACFGIMMVPLMYLMTHFITGRRKYALLATILLMSEFMHFVLSRIATLDIIIAFFVMLMFYLMAVTLDFIEKNANTIESTETPGKTKRVLLLKEAGLLLGTGLATGCAIATKWTGLYAAAGLAVLIIVYLIQHYPNPKAWLKAWKHLLFLFLVSVVVFLVIPAAIYVISFYPFLKENPSRGLIKTAYDISIYMYDYHKDTIFEHPYSSEWYEWLYVRQPLLDAIAYPGDGTASSVATFGNPVIWILGLIGLFYQGYRWTVKKDRKAQYLCICYLSMLLPWMLVFRTVFIYQYFCSALMLIPCLANSIMHAGKREKLLYIGIIVLSVLVFVMFFPVLSGLRVSQYYISHFLEWIPEWIFE